ncbi:hypothetical protein C2869_11115 [Saccharobesus litoralis]|uniref:Uncharacterized protein n=2 Tax=Saccharobesus litoralis TaxID=2172099 RepID=A0A2S0VS11_9ALTE|nr:hypothetical protein C2869_11115 [Saccharobesus litoralis]
MTGCVTTRQGYNVSPTSQVKNGQLLAAKTTFRLRYSDSGKDRLLHHLELGTINHLMGNYTQSNIHFSAAEQLSEEFYTTSISEKAAELLTGPQYTTYKGFVFENTFINYFKALNYLKKGQEDHKLSPTEIDAALVEIRRLGLRLSELTRQTGGYAQTNNTDKKQSTASEIYNLFKRAFGNSTAGLELEYKDDAFAHYLSGLLYETNRDFDSARIEYKKAATAYENGFAKQYQLNNKVVQQAWFDTIKVMLKDGGYQQEAKRLINQKLNQQQAQKVVKASQQAELVIIQHVGTVPERQRINILLTLDKRAKSLVLSPILSGPFAQRREKAYWFQMLYADNQLFDIIKNYIAGDIPAAVMGTQQKRIPLGGDLWNLAEDIGMLDALNTPITVSVPYYPAIKPSLSGSSVYINGKKYAELETVESLSLIALQEQIRSANEFIYASLTREIVKAIFAHKALKETGLLDKGIWGDIAKGATALVNILTAQADTRNWLTLPESIKLARFNLPVGEHKVSLMSKTSDGKNINQTYTVKVAADQPYILQTKTYAEQANTVNKPTNLVNSSAKPTHVSQISSIE